MIHDRRRLPRVGLRYVVEFRRSDQPQPVRAKINNINSTGFYCTASDPFSPGEQLDCDLYIPRECRKDHVTNLVLHRRVKVVRVEIKGMEPGFGVACQFEDFAVQTIDTSHQPVTH